MLTSFIGDSTLPLLEQVAAFGERRQEVLAGNVANVDTPGYCTRDLPVDEFRAALAAQVEARRSRSAPESLQSPCEPVPIQVMPRKLFQAVEGTPANLTFQDANNRSIEHELVEMSKNALMQSYAVELMTAQMNLLYAVISERA
jgi:flagellar basal-body rod protein FlgB